MTVFRILLKEKTVMRMKMKVLTIIYLQNVAYNRTCSNQNMKNKIQLYVNHVFEGKQTKYRSSYPEVLCRKDVPETENSHEKACIRVSKVPGF